MDPKTFDEIQKTMEKVAMWHGAHSNSFFGWEMAKVECREIYDYMMLPYKSHMEDCGSCAEMWGIGPMSEDGTPFSAYLTREQVESTLNKSPSSSREHCPEHGPSRHIIAGHSYCEHCYTPVSRLEVEQMVKEFT